MARIVLALILTLVLSLGLSGVTQTAAQGSRTVVASGLDSPRGLTFGPDGKLYVAEAGTGGDEPSAWVPPFQSAKIGTSGRILRVDGGQATAVATGLQSVAIGPAPEVVGPQDVVFVGSTLYALVGQANALPTGVPTLSLLVKIGADGKVETVADLGKYEKDNNPDGTVPDSNPFSLAAAPDGSLYVADAGGNDLLKVTTDGQVSTVAAWKDNPVPTSVAFDKNGRAHVGFLSPNPFVKGSARVERINGSTGEVMVPGLMTVVDLKVGPDGNLYILEHAGERIMGPPPHFLEKSGRVLRVTSSGLEAVATELNFPTKMAFGPDGALYVSNNAVGAPPKGGEVLRIMLPEKGTPVVAAAPAAQPSPAAKPAASPSTGGPLPAAPSPAAKPAAPAQAPVAAPSPSALPRTGVGPDLAATALPVAGAGAALALAGLGMLRRRRR
ncbi:MAG: ScyD/ScyE family protein [Chloroflexi bacterium]|nr:ScyD/ScyE family protein [Chloroflexota bacterium]